MGIQWPFINFLRAIQGCLICYFITGNANALGDVVVDSYKEDLESKKRSGVHTNKHIHEMFNTVFDEVHNTSQNFSFTPGRLCGSSNSFKRTFSNLNLVKLFGWIDKKKRKWDVEMLFFYDF